MTPTAEQLAILDRVRNTTDPLMLTARAGAAKTTTLSLIAEALPSSTILALAFNTKIAKEMTERLPGNATAKTLNSIGNTAFRDFRGKYPKLEKDKMFQIVTRLVDTLDPGDKTEILDDFPMLLRCARSARMAGFLPLGVNRLAKPLVTDVSEIDFGEDSPSALQLSLIDSAIRQSFTLSLDGFIDFDDQIYLPALLPVSFPRYDVVMVDEAQDLSPLNHIILRKIVGKHARLIAVGDPCQAIYGFRGADESSMETLQQSFDLEEMFLTICFRSSEEIVANARWRAPDMKSWPDTPAGLVARLDRWSLDDIADGDAVICRNNAPLFRLALNFLRSGRSPELASGDIIPGLLKIMRGLGKPDTPTIDCSLDPWVEKALTKTRSPGAVYDKAECMQIFLDSSPTLGEACKALEAVANAAGRIKLMTGHKSKGLEFTRVWFLDSHLCKPKGQDLNVKYVIETRAKRELRYIDSKGLI